MSKLPFFLLPTLLASTSALALSCYDGSTGCFKPDDVEQSAEDCRNLGYSLNEPECEHYLLCPFNTDYKICVKEKAGNIPDPTIPDNPLPDYDCASMQIKFQNAANRIYIQKCSDPNQCEDNTADCRISYNNLSLLNSYMDPCLRNLAGIRKESDPTTGIHTDPATVNPCTKWAENKCWEAELAYENALNTHNTNCPDHQVTETADFRCQYYIPSLSEHPKPALTVCNYDLVEEK